MSNVLDALLSHVPGYQNALSQVDSIRAQFLAIPATTMANRRVLDFARSKSNDATEVSQINALQAQAQSVNDQFNSVLTQFSAFDGMKQSGAPTTDLVVAGGSLVAAAQRVRSASDALTQKVAPIAAKYGQPSPAASGGNLGGALAILVGAGVVMALVLKPKRRARRR